MCRARNVPYRREHRDEPEVGESGKHDDRLHFRPERDEPSTDEGATRRRRRIKDGEPLDGACVTRRHFNPSFLFFFLSFDYHYLLSARLTLLALIAFYIIHVIVLVCCRCEFVFVFCFFTE